MAWDPNWTASKQAPMPEQQRAPPPHVQTEQMLKGIVQESEQWPVPPPPAQYAPPASRGWNYPEQSQAPGPTKASPPASSPGGSVHAQAGPYVQQQRPSPPQPVWNGQQWVYPQQAPPQQPRPPVQQQAPPQQPMQRPAAPVQRPVEPVPATKKKGLLIKTLWGLIIITTVLFIASLVYFYIVYVRN